MPLPVSLKAVVDEMEFGGDEWRGFINCKTGELAAFPGDILRDEGEVDATAPAWQTEMAENCRRVLGSKDFVPLPSRFDIHEYAIIEQFCLSVDRERDRDDLLDAIRGRRAFRRFKDLVHELGIHEDWYRYRDQALRQIATEFLEANGIPYTDESSGEAR